MIGQGVGYPVGMLRKSTPEFRRRIVAAVISYQMQLSSIDYTLKRYVEPDLYEDETASLGDATSDFLRDSVEKLMRGLRELHAKQPTFGVFGAELTLYRIPHSLDAARMLSNRGLLLEVLPILRLCLEMMAWANTAFVTQDENDVMNLKAQSCISHMKSMYKPAGKLYGYLSTFSHWGHAIHGQFIDIRSGQVSILNASIRYRAMALALCVVILDIFLEVVRNLYGERSYEIITSVQGVIDRDLARNTCSMLFRIAELTALKDLEKIKSFLH